MRLPFDLLTQNYVKPQLFLCEVDKTKICQLETTNLSGSFKFNTYSELTFTVGRTYINMITGETQVNPFYDKIEALRLVYLNGFGYFEIQEPEIESDGIREVKNITAYSLEYRLSQRYLEKFYVNTGEVDSLEVIAAEGSRIIPITLVNMANEKLSLIDLTLERVYDWTWGHIDDSLKSMSRQFEISRASVYDFIVQDICDKFNCYAVFDTINNKINLYAESLVSKYIGDGKSDTFIVFPPYSSIGTVSVDGYKTTKYGYDPKTGSLVFKEIPNNGSRIEVTDGSQEKWQTDVYVTFNNLAQEVNVSYSADDIKTVLTVNGADDLGIHEVNMGLPYIVDLSYYYNVDWMGQDLYDSYTEYLKNNNNNKDKYTNNAQEILKLQNDIDFIENRTSLGYGIDNSVNSETVGTYYVISGGSYPNYHYREVSLPKDYNANTIYYKINGVNVTEEKVHTLFSAIRKYFITAHQQVEPEIRDIATKDGTWEELLEQSIDSFKFVSKEFEVLKDSLKLDTSVNNATNAVKTFLNIIWGEMGRTPLKSLFLEPYKTIESANKEAGYSDPNSDYYWFYYPVTIMIESLNKAIEIRSAEIKKLETDLKDKQDINAEIAKEMSIYNYFNKDQLARLTAFLREDEYTDDNFIETDSDTIEILMKTKQELLECGRIELAKLCEPKLSFSMDMANIYALPEFEPIIDQFQLGNLINVAIRDDYIKRARLLAVNVNFDDFSDFSCEFGELTNLKTPSSIHADLLANALSAGKSVSSNQSYWEKGADLATATDLKIQNGLLNAIDGIYNGDKSVLIDNHGILLRKVEDNGEYSPYQIWLTNNNILVSTDYFDTAQTGIGVFEVDGKELYGVLAKAVLSGYIESSTIVGGTINIGNGAFVVHSDGTVTMNSAGNIIDGYAKSEDVNQQIQDVIDEVKNAEISDVAPSNPKNGQLWVNTATDPYEVMIFNQPNENEPGEWVYFSQQYGGTVYTEKPSKYYVGDLWILAQGEVHGQFGPGSILKADENLNWIDAISEITAMRNNVNQYFEFNDTTGLKIGQKDQKFYTRITSQRMSFCENPNVTSSASAYIDPNEVAYIGNRSANIKNLVVEEHAEFNCNADFNGQINIGDAFVLKLESNGSLSLAVAK